jgi:hypothetical protein
VQGHQHKVNHAKDIVLFKTISSKYLLHILGYVFCTEHYIFSHFYQNDAAIESIKNYLHKSLCGDQVAFIQLGCPGVSFIYQFAKCTRATA